MKWFPLAIIGIVLLVGVTVFSVGKQFTGLFASKTTLVTGKFDINGPIASTDTISLGVKAFGAPQYDIFQSGLSAKDVSTWQYAAAKTGIYSFQAYLIRNGETITKSDPETIAVPATDVTLRFVVAGPANTTGSIQGTFDINGVIPSGTQIDIYAREIGKTEFEPVKKEFTAKDGGTWSWDAVKTGVTYEVKGVAYANSREIIQSVDVSRVSAPASNEHIRFNMPAPKPTAAPTQAPTNAPTSTPAQPVSISGVIRINGTISNGSTINVDMRKHGSNASFSRILTGLGASSNVSWNWSGATNGYMYDIQAHLKTGDQTIASSSIVTVSAPARDETLTISNFPLNKPGNGVSTSCLGQDGSGKWRTSFSYQAMDGGSNYWIQALDGGNNVLWESKVGVSNQQSTYAITTDFRFVNGATYNVRYAYSLCDGCGNYSPFNSTNSFFCTTPAPPPANTPTNTPTNSPVPPTPTPTLPPNTSQCNETCGTNGYACVLGLQCVSGDLIGQSVCRNPNCTASTDCVCR